MALERLEFEGPNAGYHSYSAAQHVVRYASVKDWVKGKRVLDIACGAGYGVRLLSDWGAAEVVGIDIAPAAIATAKRRFNGPGRTFLSGDAESLTSLLDGEKPFDVIVSFETVEHLAHPERLIEAVSKLRAPHGIVALSCPNDRIYQTDNGGNPFHLNNFTFEEFKALCEHHLGSASQWLIGAPVHGEINFVVGDPKVELGRADAEAIAAPDTLDNALLLASQKGLEVDAASCSHYIGFWGARPGANAVVSVQSVSSYRDSWLTLDRLKGHVDELERRAADYFEPEIARLNAVVAEYENAKREWFEPELERLQSTVDKNVRDRKALLREVQDQRARVLYYVDQVAMLASQIDPLRARAEELERNKRDWLDPELQRMHAAIERYEKTKREWFEPQLQQHQVRIAELEARLVSMVQFERSLNYRAWRRLQMVDELPVIGSVMRGMRRAVGVVVRR